MKTLLFLLLALAARAADICVFDPASPTVANRVVSYLKSQDTAVWTGNPNCVINPAMPAGIALTLLKVSAGTVVEMTQPEKDSLAAADVTAANAAAAAYIVEAKGEGKTTFDAAHSNARLFRSIADALLDEVNTLRGQIIGTGSLVYDPASMANATGLTSASIAVTGAAFGDYVDVAAPYSLAGITATAYVAAAGQINIRLHNGTGAAVNLVSGTWTVCVRRQSALPARTAAQARTAIQTKIDAQP